MVCCLSHVTPELLWRLISKHSELTGLTPEFGPERHRQRALTNLTKWNCMNPHWSSHHTSKCSFTHFTSLLALIIKSAFYYHKLVHFLLLLQSLLGTHNLGRVHYEPIKDRHGNVLLVTIRDMDSQHSLFSGKWMQVTKLQSQRKSLSTPEEPYALDILIITIQVRKNMHCSTWFLLAIWLL